MLGVVWVGGLGIYPALLQRFRVTPNELEAERPVHPHNIRMTRQAYGLDRIVEQEFPARDTLDARAIERNEATIKNIRLWDYRPLLRTYGQLQEIRTYYKFVDVDNDRYTIGGEYRQLMLSPRELSYAHLQSRIWINEHLTFTHGYGVGGGSRQPGDRRGASRVLREGHPARLHRAGFRPSRVRRSTTARSATSTCSCARAPRSSTTRRATRTSTPTYTGRGGIPIGSWLRKLAFAARFGEIKILLSNDLTADSRIMIHRTVTERVRRIAPFFRFDRDPYLVVTGDGRLVWMLDGYTTSDRYPYSDPVRTAEWSGNYIRNSVKAVDRRLPRQRELLRGRPVRSRGPGLRAELPRACSSPSRACPRICAPTSGTPRTSSPSRRGSTPRTTWRIPQVFYNKEDLWAIPRRTIEGREREMEPYYTIMRLPGERREEFILLTLFNPARRDNMIAWLAARSDPPHYGRLIAYNFPKQKLVFGPRQVDARIDQDPVISQQLALWNQRGSTVIRGSLLAIPIDESLIYVQPLYLAAAEQGALPELRRVIVAYGNQIAMEPTLEQSLARIFGGRAGAAPAAAAPGPAAGLAPGVSTAAQRAWEIWTRAQDALRRGDWAAYGAEQKRLEEALRALLEPAR